MALSFLLPEYLNTDSHSCWARQECPARGGKKKKKKKKEKIEMKPKPPAAVGDELCLDCQADTANCLK